MGWQFINTLVRTITNDNEIAESVGYAIGTDDENGYYAFLSGPWHTAVGNHDKPYIAQEFSPHLTFRNMEYRIMGFLFNNKPVFRSGDAPYRYIFYSTRESLWIADLTTDETSYAVREPNYYTDIDETTVKGDVFYKGTLPQLNGTSASQFEIAGNVSDHQSWSQTEDMTMDQEIWEWSYNGIVGMNNSGFCGQYLNSTNQTWKYVGIPQWTAVSNNPQGEMYYSNEVFTKSWDTDSTHHYTYVGDKGHVIHQYNGQWFLGTENHGKWSVSDTEPNVQNSVSFVGYKIDEGTQTPVSDPKGTFNLNFRCLVPGDKTNNLYIGEVSLWRTPLTESN